MVECRVVSVLVLGLTEALNRPGLLNRLSGCTSSSPSEYKHQPGMTSKTGRAAARVDSATHGARGTQARGRSTGLHACREGDGVCIRQISSYTHAHTHTRTRTHTHTHTHARTHTRTHARTHARTHTHLSLGWAGLWCVADHPCPWDCHFHPSGLTTLCGKAGTREPAVAKKARLG